MARIKNVKATLREGLREKNALNKTYTQRIDAFESHVKNIYETTRLMHEKDETIEIIDRRRMTKEQILEYIPAYIEERRALGKSEATLHTDLAALCKALDVSMERFETIHRGQPKRGRDPDSRRDRNDDNYKVIDFASMVGIRKNEYKELQGRDFIERDGQFYVVVRHGKGGKYQEQLIAPCDVEQVRSYFAGKEPNDYIFSLQEINACHHANLHEIRRKHAQEMYIYYKELLKDPEQRDAMKDLLERRFNENTKKAGKFDRDLMDREYVCRGTVREEIISQGKEYVFDRLAAMAVSNLHLAHYRIEVFTKHYWK